MCVHLGCNGILKQLNCLRGHVLSSILSENVENENNTSWHPYSPNYCLTTLMYTRMSWLHNIGEIEMIHIMLFKFLVCNNFSVFAVNNSLCVRFSIGL